MAHRKGVIIKWQNQEAVKEKCNQFITSAKRKQIAFLRNCSKFSNKKGTPPPAIGVAYGTGWLDNVKHCRPCYIHSEQMYYSMVRPKTQVQGGAIFAPVFKEDHAE